MKLSLFKVSILFALMLATTAYGQQQGLSYNFFGGGARSEGMGQAFLAVSDDGTAGSWNPAGLYIHEKTLMVFSYSFLMPRGNYSYYIDNAVYNTYSRDIMWLPMFPIQEISTPIIYPPKIFLTAGWVTSQMLSWRKTAVSTVLTSRWVQEYTSSCHSAWPVMSITGGLSLRKTGPSAGML